MSPRNAFHTCSRAATDSALLRSLASNADQTSPSASSEDTKVKPTTTSSTCSESGSATYRFTNTDVSRYMVGSVTAVAHFANQRGGIWRHRHGAAQCRHGTRRRTRDHWPVTDDHRLGFAIARDDDLLALCCSFEQ